MGARGKRSAMSRFHLRVTVPVGAALVIWAALTAATLAGLLGRPWSGSPWWAAGLGLVIVVVALTRAASYAREVAAENGDLRTALADLRQADRSAATAEAGARDGLRQVLVSLGRRNQSLIHRQLRIIDRLERQASGSAELGELFTLDHLTTRMRRHAESLTVLAGEAPGRSWGTPVPVLDVMRAASAEIEDYKRVLVRSSSDSFVAAPAVTDMIHLLAELIENATLFSPSSTKVEMRAGPTADGLVIEIEDRGLGIPAEQLRVLNARLAEAAEAELADADRLGLFVAARLAARHGVGISLSPSPHRGTRAVVVLPADLIVAAEPADRETAGPVGRGPAGEHEAARLDLQAPGILALAGSEKARRADPATAGPSVFTPSLESLSNPGNPVNPAASGWFTAPPPEAPVPEALPPEASAPESPAPAAQTPKAQTPKARTPKARTPEAQTPGVPELPVRERAKPELPRRVRSAANRPTARSAPPDSPAPDQARTLASSLQSSWRRSEADDAARGLANEEES